MPIDLNLSEPPPREQRLNAIVGYDGTLDDLTEKGCNGCLQNKDRCFSTIMYCSHMTALSSVLALQDTLVVDHAPVGCSGTYMVLGAGLDFNAPMPGGGYRPQARMITTKLSESDVIFGAGEKLRNVVRAAYERHKPKEIYIATSCVSAIIGEDVHSIAQELSKELGIKVEMVGTAGMRSKMWATGFDAYAHAVSKTRFKPSKEKTDTVIYTGFASVAVETIQPIFKRFGYDVICLTGGGSIEDFGRASSAVAAFGQCDVQASYFLNYLAQEYGVKYFHKYQPNGGIGFERFLREFGAYVGKPEIAEEIIAEEKEKYGTRLDEIKSKLKGKRAIISLGSGYTYEAARMLSELDVETVHAIAYHYDPTLDIADDHPYPAAGIDLRELKLNPDTSVNNAQEMEVYQVIKKYRPDIVISRAHGASGWAAKTGVPSLDMGLGINLIGYRGLYLLGSALVSVLKNTNFFDKLAERYKSPFTEEFENLGPHKFYAEEAL
jgi:nitrogenase molybdenum-iron protein alpha chain